MTDMNDMCYYINVIQHDATLVSLKKKQADSISEMYVFNTQMKMRLVSKSIINVFGRSEQMDQLNKMKAKYFD